MADVILFSAALTAAIIVTVAAWRALHPPVHHGPALYRASNSRLLTLAAARLERSDPALADALRDRAAVHAAEND